MSEITAITIPDFTVDDYMNTDEPYEWLYTFKDNKFLLKQLTQRMKAKAGAIGVKCFVSLFNAYCESVAAKQGVRFDNSTQFDGQSIELFCGEYICDDFGITLTDKYGFENIICRHPIMPVRRLINIDTNEERLELEYKKGKTWRNYIAEKSVIASSSQILNLAAYGIMVNSENAKALSTFLLNIEELNYDTIPEQKSVGRLGWVMSHGFSPYVEHIEFDGETNFKHIFNAVKPHGDREKWIEAMRKVRAEKTVGRLFLAASFASAILEPCGLLPFFFHAWGGTETGKTVGLMIAASVWACPKMGEYITTFNSTIVGQEMTATFLNSLPMCVDELQIQSSQGIKDFDRIIYQLTEGVGRTRGAKLGGLQKQNTWKNCIITNGEHPISNANSGGGAINRIIEVECASKIYSDLVGLCAVMADNYGWAGREFVEYLQQDGMSEKVNAMQKEFYRELLKSDSTDKQAASASAILAADAIATELIFKDGNALTCSDLANIMAKKQEVDVNARALEYIYELVGRNPMHFLMENFFDDCRSEVWGKIDLDYIYIVKSVFDREMAAAGFNSTSFLAWAKRNGYIVCDKDGRRTKKAKVGDSVINTVCLFRDIEKAKAEQIKNAEQSDFDEELEDLPFD